MLERQSSFLDAREIAKYILFGNDPPLNLFYFLDLIYGGLSVQKIEKTGVCKIVCPRKKFEVLIPASLIGENIEGPLSKDNAVTLAVACCRESGVGGFCYSWTRRTQPIFNEVVEVLGPSFGMWDWRLAQAWRFERSDVYENLTYLFMSFSALLPTHYQQESIADSLFQTAWQLSTEQARRVGGLAKGLEIYVVQCEPDRARILVCDVGFYITQRDWSVLALVMLFTDYGNGIELIERARHSMRLVE